MNDDVLPPYVNVLTFEPWNDDSFLLRLDHTLDTKIHVAKRVNLKVCSIKIITGVSVSFFRLYNFLSQKLFKGMTITNVRETTLGANQWLDDYLRQDKYQWKLKGEAEAIISHRNDASDWEIDLLPMEIRTFVITFANSKYN